jgi:hypothetical protein
MRIHLMELCPVIAYGEQARLANESSQPAWLDEMAPV